MSDTQTSDTASSGESQHALDPDLGKAVSGLDKVGDEAPTTLDILYHAKCEEGGVKGKVFYSEKPFDGLDLHELYQVKPKSLLEVVFTVKGKNVENSRETDEYKRYDLTEPSSRAKFGVDGDFIPDSIGDSTLHIHSQHLKDELRRIVKYYPSQNLNGDTVIVKYPYRILMHCITQLEDAKNVYEAVSKDQSQSTHPTPHQEKEKVHALKVLLDYLKPIFAKEIEFGAARQRLPSAMTTYPMLWYLFVPGTDVYAKVGGKWRAFVVISAEEKKKPDDREMSFFFRQAMGSKRVDKWRIKTWSLAIDGKRLVRRGRTFEIEKFYGEREIATLSLVPCKIYDALYGKDRRDELIQRGRIFYSLLKSLPNHFNYSGVAVAKHEKRVAWDEPLKRAFEYTGEVVIDPESYKKHGPAQVLGVYYREEKHKKIPEDDGETDDENQEWEPAEEPEAFGGGPLWEAYKDIQPREGKDLLKHQLMLLPADIRGFALKTKQWMAFDAKQLEPIKFPQKGQRAIDNLILSPTDVQYLKALSKRTSLSKSHIDFIKGKGEGQIFLFHGPPGTGKTYTVEAIAQYTNRPLLSLTVADLGLSEDKLEMQLTKWFQVAAHWGAILLIDEADVFLEKRRSSDVNRNSLVSLFLRSMEYYRGLLFLTTNRPGAIDDAFRSRIHSAINFPSFNNDKSERLWTVFLDKIKKEDPKIRVTPGAKRFLSTDKTIKKMDWSGREIRNAFTLALTLARYDHESNTEKAEDDPIEVGREHFEDVIIRRDEFIRYIDSIREMKEDERAYEVGDRRDATLDRHSD